MAKRLEIDGVFRGNLIEWSVGETRTGGTQFKALLRTTERYDREAQKWVAHDLHEIVAYLTLVSKGDTLSWAENLAKALNYDGTVDMTEFLNTEDFSNTVVQIRVSWDDYKGKDKLKVTDILRHDAPLQNFVKLAVDDAKTLGQKNKIIIPGLTKTEVAASIETLTEAEVAF